MIIVRKGKKDCLGFKFGYMACMVCEREIDRDWPKKTYMKRKQSIMNEYVQASFFGKNIFN